MIRSKRTRLRTVVALAADVIAPAWPLDTFVAVNPLLGFESLSFSEATARAADLFGARVLPDTPRVSAAPRDAAGERTSRWLAAYADRGEASWPMPQRERGFFAAWKRLAVHENDLAPTAPAYRRAVRALPDRADDALIMNLDALDIPFERWIDELSRRLARNAGWAAFIKRSMERDGGAGIDLIAFLAVYTWYERCFGALPPLPRVFDCTEHARTIDALATRERAFADDLVGRLLNAPSVEPQRAGAQVVFCIDVRSEPLRRALEAAGPYETFGFAGFFGIPFRHRAFDAVHDVAQAPVLLRPSNVIEERPDRSAGARFRRSAQREHVCEALARGALSHPLAAFAGVEVFGPIAALRAAWRTFVPRRRAVRPAPAALTLDGLPFDERVLFAEAILRLMGMTRDFAPLVVFCGHGGGTINNAFAAALDCGACGGNRGLINARVAALVLNDGEVRSALAHRGLVIPAATVFVAAQHDTTRDAVAIDDVPPRDRPIAAALAVAFASAGAQTRRARAATLPGAAIGASDPLARADDWAQVRPEWGLARNAAIVIGPRARTAGIDLDGRCFLHSYAPDDDLGGAALEQILTAPLIVAEWINMHYFFATVDPERFGSGDKVLQQPVGGIGVLNGNGGDIRLGLPLQSTTIGDTPYHEPVRLLAVVFAPRERINAIVARQQVLQRLFDHRWVSLVAIESGVAYRYTGAAAWQPVRLSEKEPCSQTR